MTVRHPPAVLLLLLMAAGSGCFVTDREGIQIKSDIMGLRAQLKSTEDKLRASEQRLAEIGTDLDRTTRTTQLSRADNTVTIEQIRSEIQTLTGHLDEWRHAVGRESADSRRVLAGIEERLAIIERRLGIAPVPDAPVIAGDSNVRPSDTAPPLPASDREAYNQARDLVNRDQTVEGRRMLAAFLARFPDSKYADNAQYWIGESYFREGNHQQAVQELKKVVQLYPDGDTMDYAYFLIGDCFVKLGLKDDARLFYQNLLVKYPSSSLVPKAKRRLAGLQ